MPAHYPISIEIDGRRFSGTWSLKQGNCLSVAWPEGATTVELSPGERPEARASKVLRELVTAWLKQRAAWERKRRR